MLYDNLNIAEGSELRNATIAAGIAFPTESSVGELFYLTAALDPDTLSGLYIYTGSFWRAVQLKIEAAPYDATFITQTPDAAIPAAQLTTARNIQLSGAVTGSVSFNGTSDININTTVNHTHAFSEVLGKPTTVDGIVLQMHQYLIHQLQRMEI